MESKTDEIAVDYKLAALQVALVHLEAVHSICKWQNKNIPCQFNDEGHMVLRGLSATITKAMASGV